MHVLITPSGAELTDPENFTAFDVQVGAGVDVAVLHRFVPEVGDYEPGQGFPSGHVHVRTGWLRAEAARQGLGGDWTTGFDGMLRHAASKGWTSAGGTTVRGHVVGTPS